MVQVDGWDRPMPCDTATMLRQEGGRAMAEQQPAEAQKIHDMYPLWGKPTDNLYTLGDGPVWAPWESDSD